VTIRVYFDEAYIPPGASVDTLTKSADVAALVRDRVDLVAPAPLTDEEIARVHARAYVDAVRTGSPEMLAWSSGVGWTPGLFPAVAASSGGVVAAALEALASGRNAGSLSSGLHHARREAGGGYCTFNGLALAADAAERAGATSILVLDLDAHCGGGTHELLADDDAVRVLDIATSDFDHYAPEPGWTLDVLARAADYLPTLRRRLDDLARERLDLVLYNAGMDPHEDCLTGGLHGMTTEVLAEREEAVFRWARERGVPVAFVLAGGYRSARLTRDQLASLHAMTVDAATKW
jgi:acetoin utilization deacetylase AcuC-like enzyme